MTVFSTSSIPENKHYNHYNNIYAALHRHRHLDLFEARKDNRKRSTIGSGHRGSDAQSRSKKSRIKLLTGSNKFPRLHNPREPGIELLIGSHFIEKAAVDEPHLARLADSGIQSIKCKSGCAIDGRRAQLLPDS